MAHARAYFPRGLHQPDGGFRFSTDALLLAAFAAQYVQPPDTLHAANAPHRAERHGTPNAARTLLDLGTGCGVVAFGVQLLSTLELCAWGLDREPDLLSAACVNARQLGFTKRFTPVMADLARPDACRTLTESRYDNNFPGFRPENKRRYALTGIAKARLHHDDRLRKPARRQAYSSARRATLRYRYRKWSRLVFAPLKRCMPHSVSVNSGAAAFHAMPAAYNLITANPPYRLLGRGRLPASRLRREALFGTHDTLLHFVRAARFYLAADGTACFCIPVERAKELLCLIIDNGLLPTSRLDVRAQAHKAPYLCLIAACRHSGNARTPRKALDTNTTRALFRSDLVLMEPGLPCAAARNKETSKDSGMRYTAQALAFCPFLGAGHEPLGV